MGGSLNQAKNEAPPVDIRWKQFDISGFKDAPLDIPAAMMSDNYGGSSGRGKTLGGLPSDVAYVNSQLKFYRDKLKQGLSGPNAKEYGESKEATYDSDQVTKWAESLAMLKAREDDFKAKQVKLLKATGDDYAMAGGKSLVKETGTGNYSIIDTNDILSSRIKDEKGSIKPKYTPVNVGEALQVRMSDPEFSGFNNETGGVLDAILGSVQDTDTVEKSMNDVFSKVGSINLDNNTFIHNATGTTLPMEGLIGDLTNAAKEYAKGSTKTNQKNLEFAVNLFKQNMNPVQWEALRGRAISQFMSKFGNKEVDTAGANDWIDAKINEDIANRAMSYLKVSQGKGAKGTSATASDGSGLDKKKMDTNLITQAQMGGIGESTPMEVTAYKDAEDLKQNMSVLANFPSSSLPLRDGALAGAKNIKKDSHKNLLAENSMMYDLSNGNIRTNLFLPDEKSTPIYTLNKGQGLNTSAINTTQYGGNMHILRGVPYTVDENGNNKIAWDKITKAAQWGKEFGRLAKDKLKLTKAAHLTEAESEEIAKQASVIVKEDFSDTSNIKIGNVAMIPIVVYDTDKGYDDPDLDSYMQSGVSGDEEALIDIKSIIPDALHSGNKKRTFALTILSKDPMAARKEAYGPAFERKDPLVVGDFLNQLKAAQLVDKSGFDWVNTALTNSYTDITK